MHFHEHGALLILFPLFGRTLLWFRQRDSTFFRNDSQGVGKLAALHLHHEIENVPAFAATKAVINLPRRMHVEGRSLFRMKRTQPAKILPRLFQLDVLAHHADNVRLLLYALRNGSRFRHAQFRNSTTVIALPPCSSDSKEDFPTS